MIANLFILVFNDYQVLEFKIIKKYECFEYKKYNMEFF